MRASNVSQPRSPASKLYAHQKMRRLSRLVSHPADDPFQQVIWIAHNKVCAFDGGKYWGIRKVLSVTMALVDTDTIIHLFRGSLSR